MTVRARRQTITNVRTGNLLVVSAGRSFAMNACQQNTLLLMMMLSGIVQAA